MSGQNLEEIVRHTKTETQISTELRVPRKFKVVLLNDDFTPMDFVVEVLSDGTEHRDRGIKFNDYAAHGVAEYWIIDPQDETIEQYFLEGEVYKLHLKLSEGLIRSKVVEGFAIEVKAVFEEELNLAELRRILEK